MDDVNPRLQGKDVAVVRHTCFKADEDLNLASAYTYAQQIMPMAPTTRMGPRTGGKLMLTL